MPPRFANASPSTPLSRSSARVRSARPRWRAPSRLSIRGPCSWTSNAKAIVRCSLTPNGLGRLRSLRSFLLRRPKYEACCHAGRIGSLRHALIPPPSPATQGLHSPRPGAPAHLRRRVRDRPPHVCPAPNRAAGNDRDGGAHRTERVAASEAAKPTKREKSPPCVICARTSARQSNHLVAESRFGSV